MKNLNENALMQEINVGEMQNVNGGSFLLGSAGSWFFKGLGIGATAGGIGAGIALCI